MKILVTIPVKDNHIKMLSEAARGNEIIYKAAADVTADDVRDVEVIFGNIAPALLSNCRNLKLLQLFTAGTDGYTKLVPSGATLSNTTGAFGLAISEHMLGMMFMLMKRLHQYRDNQSKGVWRDMGTVNSVQGARVLVIGLGNIGGEFARKAKALGAYTIGVRRHDTNKPDYIDELYMSDRIDDLLPTADVIAMALPNTSATVKILNKKRIDSLKNGAMILNVGRGSAIDTDALADAVEAGRVLCGLDVTDPEPLPEGHKLWKLENAFITPHISGFFHLAATQDNMVRIAAENIERLLDGKEFINVIDLESGYCRK